MSPEKEAEIYKACPYLFSSPVLGGFSIGDGWYDVFKKMCQDIDEILRLSPNTRFALTQVKTKFGEPRIYSGGTKVGSISNIISKAQSEMMVTCEACGEPGEYSEYAVLCPSCEDERARTRGRVLEWKTR